MDSTTVDLPDSEIESILMEERQLRIRFSRAGGGARLFRIPLLDGDTFQRRLEFRHVPAESGHLGPGSLHQARDEGLDCSRVVPVGRGRERGEWRHANPSAHPPRELERCGVGVLAGESIGRGASSTGLTPS